MRTGTRATPSVENLWSAKPNRFLVAEVGELEPGRALDLACGEGQNAIWLATLGWDVVGVDYPRSRSRRRASRAEREGVEVEFVCADLVELRARTRRRSTSSLVLYLHIPADQRASRAREGERRARTGRHVRSSSATTSRT